MKKDLLFAGALVIVALCCIAGVVFFFETQSDANVLQTVRPKSEPIVQIEKPRNIEVPKPVNQVVKQIPIKAPEKIPIEPKVVPEPIEKKNSEPEVVAKVDLPKKVEPPTPVKVAVKAPREIVLGNLIKLNDVDGEYVIEPMQSRELVLIGKIKTLKVDGANGASTLDASGLDAEEVLITGDINGKSKLKLNAPSGVIHFQREINGRSEIDVSAPDGKVIFKSTHASIINGESKLTIVARDVLFLGDINGARTTVDVTLTKAGSLKFLRILGEVRLQYGRAEVGDPEPRLESGVIGPNARLRKIEPNRK